MSTSKVWLGLGPGAAIGGAEPCGLRGADAGMARRFSQQREARMLAMIRPVFPGGNEPGGVRPLGGNRDADAGKRREPDGGRCVQRGADRGIAVRGDAAARGVFSPGWNESRTRRRAFVRSAGREAWSAWRKREVAARDFLRDSKH